jgi:hypothetical protein
MITSPRLTSKDLPLSAIVRVPGRTSLALPDFSPALPAFAVVPTDFVLLLPDFAPELAAFALVPDFRSFETSAF